MSLARRKEAASELPLLRTCQTCFHAKIKCVKTQDSGVCDRCLRLKKSCVFAQSKRRIQPRPGGRISGPIVRGSSNEQQPSTRLNQQPGIQQDSSEKAHGDDACCPFLSGGLTLERGQELLDLFRTRMSAHFPFVLVSSHGFVQSLNKERPALCLAILTVASYDSPPMQQALGERFNQLVCKRLATGQFASIELLQGLLIHLAWAQYQPTPKRYSQYLGLAISIVSDLRIDQPMNTKFWGVGSGKDNNGLDWGPDETRALLGTYYLASSLEVLLQKSKTLGYKSYYLQRCQQLSMQSTEPTDKYLPLIIHAQRIIEAMNDTWAGNADSGPFPSLKASIEELRHEIMNLKASIVFPLNESRILALQLHISDLLLDQYCPGENVFGLDRLQENQLHYQNTENFLTWLSDSMLAVKAVVNISLSLPVGDEPLITNLEWVTLYCGLSLAARLDLVAAHPSIIRTTKRLRQFADVGHVLRQAILRLESAARNTGDQNVFLNLATKAKRLEEWYLNHLTHYATGTNSSGSSIGGYASNLGSSLLGDSELNPTIDSLLVSEMMAGFEADPDFGTLSFVLPGSFDP